MSLLVVDASVAMQWVVPEDGSADAVALPQRARLAAPELLIAECANALWKKVRRREFSPADAYAAARLLSAAKVEFLTTSHLLEATTQIAVEMGHPAYDCVYLALALERGCRLITADERFVRRISQTGDPSWRAHVVRLAEAESAL